MSSSLQPLPLVRWLAVALLLSLQLACATKIDTRSDVDAALKEGIRDQQPAAAGEPPADVSAALMPPIAVTVPGVDPNSTEQRFDVTVRRAPAREFFLGLVAGTPYNMVVSPDVNGTITLDLKNVTVAEVMETVRDVYGYDFEKRGTRYQLFGNGMQTRIFNLNYIDVKRAGTSKISAGATNITKSASTATDSTGGSTTSSTEASTITTDSAVSFWQALEANLRLIVGNGSGRSVSVNSQAGMVMVRAMPQELREVKRFLDTTQSVVQRQVILEARILEVQLSDGYQTGINWGELRGSAGDRALFGFGQNNSATSSQASGSSSGGAIDTSLFSSSLTRSFTMGLYRNSFTAMIDLLRSQGEVQVLSSPRISTLNNQKAVIKVGGDEFFVTDITTTTTTTATTTNPNVSVELTPFFSGVTLDVTPQISEEGDVILHVHPSVSEVREQVKDVTVTTTTLRMPLAASTVRESDSVIRAQNGQIVVIGGLMQTKTQDEKAGLPLLGDIPLLGYLFSHTSKVQRKSELVILLKPVVVEEGGNQWSDDLGRASQSIQKMNQ